MNQILPGEEEVGGARNQRGNSTSQKVGRHGEAPEEGRGMCSGHRVMWLQALSREYIPAVQKAGGFLKFPHPPMKRAAAGSAGQTPVPTACHLLSISTPCASPNEPRGSAGPPTPRPLCARWQEAELHATTARGLVCSHTGHTHLPPTVLNSTGTRECDG